MIQMNVANLLGELYSIFSGKVSKYTYVGYPPVTITDDMTDFVVITAGSNISDTGAFAKGVINIHLYSKNKSNGIMNAYSLSEMENKLNDTINNYQGGTDAKLSFSVMAGFNNRDVERGFSITTYLINVIVL